MPQTDLSNYIGKIKKLPPEEQREILALVEQMSMARTRENARVDFLDFVRHVWPAFIAGDHHKIMANAFERVAKGELKRLIINMPPRHTKSEFASYLFPAWFLGNHPEREGDPDSTHR
jgi:hypothetical protein